MKRIAGILQIERRTAPRYELNVRVLYVVEGCVLDARTRMCRGCYRTIDEVAEWVEYTPEEKLAVLERVAQRKKEAEEQ